MKRSPLKRKTPMRRGKRINARSAKKEKRDEVRAAMLMRLLMERGNACEADVPDVCKHVACDGHERLTRGRGGSEIDEGNVLLVCRSCHDWIHQHPAAAVERGLLSHSWDAA